MSYFAICDAYPFLYKKVDKFVVLSSAAQKDIYAGHKYMYDKEIIKIYNPTYFSLSSCNKEKVEEYSTKYGDFILMVSRFEWRKAHEIAIEAVKRLKEKGVDRKIVFVGSGETLDGHKKFAEKIGIADNCIFTGYQSNVQDYIAASHVNLLTSRWEGLPTVIVEAMTIGKPCVMTNSDDGEVSGNGKYCKLVEQRNDLMKFIKEKEQERIEKDILDFDLCKPLYEVLYKMNKEIVDIMIFGDDAYDM